jgi:hypothetical protein
MREREREIPLFHIMIFCLFVISGVVFFLHEIFSMNLILS